MVADGIMGSHGVVGPLPEQVRVSVGSAIVMGLMVARLDSLPTTAYLMTYRRGRCSANCGFCPQARGSRGRSDMLSRVSWPAFKTDTVVDCLKKAVEGKGIRRVCVQALNYDEAIAHVKGIVSAIHGVVGVPISVSCQPANEDDVRQLADAGADRIGIPLDAATKEVFDRVKGHLAEGPYDWTRQLELLERTVQIFYRGKVSTHLIVGLGETEQEMVSTIQWCVDMGVLPALFAFTPISGTALESLKQPSIRVFRRIQLARHLIVHGKSRATEMRFDRGGRLVGWGVPKTLLVQIMRTSEPFLTSGCPNCNRPYYNERPGGPIYSYPKPLASSDLAAIETELAIAEA